MNTELRFKDTIKELSNTLAEIDSLTNDSTVDEFISDPKTVFAVTYLLIRLSFAAKQISRYARNRDENLPSGLLWKKTAGLSHWFQGYRQKISPAIIWQTVQNDVPKIKKGVHELAIKYHTEIIYAEKPASTRIKLTSATEISLTSYSLQYVIVPYLEAITDLQRLIDEILDRQISSGVIIKSITQNSPIGVNFSGALEATQLIQETIIPWKRHHAQAMAKLLESEKIAEIEIKRAEVLQTRALASKEKVEAEKIKTEINLQNEQAEKLRLENEKLRVEIQRAKIELAMEILDKLKPSSDEQDKIGRLIRLLPIIDKLAASDLVISK